MWLVRRGGLEPPTRCLEGSRSVRTELPARDTDSRGSSPAGRRQNVTVAVFEHVVVRYSQTLYVNDPPLVETTSIAVPELADAEPNRTPFRYKST